LKLRATPEWKPMMVTQRKSILVLVLALAVCSAACNHPASQGEIVVAAAISLKDSFQALANLFTARTGVKVDFSFGASGELMKQIEAGAPVDVFASAGEPEMNELQAKGLVDPSSRKDFAQNSMVLVTPEGSTQRLRSFQDLVQPAVKRIAMGNPKTVPAGMYAQQLLQNLSLLPKLTPRLIYAENVRQVLDYVARDEVNAGIVYSTDVAIAHGKVVVVARAPQGSCGPILYPIAIVKSSQDGAAALRFVQFVAGSEGQDVLRKFGFLAVK
jgi:molybdate transport system substrate-binding protein